MAEFIPPRLESLSLQAEAQKLLMAFVKQPSTRSFLWTGPEGSGKKTHALALVRSLFCQQGPSCPGCAACKQVLSKTHPDLFWVHRDFFWSPETEDKKKQGIVVNVAKHLADKLNRAAFSAPFKVAVIPDAEDLNPDAQNVLLKTLEEPPANTIIILLAKKTGDFLPTVLSRCRLIRFHALSATAIENILAGTYGWKKDEAHKAAKEAGGNLTLALKMGEGEWTQFRDKVCADFDRGLMGPEEDWLALGSEYDQWEPDFLGDAELTATQRKAEVLRAAFQVYLALWSRRLAKEVETPKALASLSADQVLKSLQKHQDIIEQNLHAKMILDHLFLELREGFRKGYLSNLPFTELSVQI